MAALFGPKPNPLDVQFYVSERNVDEQDSIAEPFGSSHERNSALPGERTFQDEALLLIQE
jgi:hypothetical protein